MKIGEPVDRRIPWVRKIHDLDDARAVGASGPRMKALRRAGERLGGELRDGPRVISVRTLPVAPILYPTKFAFNKACRMPVPFVVMTNRTLLIQLLADGEVKNVLFNPTDKVGSQEAPFIRKLKDQLPKMGASHFEEMYPTTEAQLAELGLSGEDIDVVAFDHFHVQDLRPIVGSREPRFPNALLLAPRAEWIDWDDLHPLQRYFYVADGKQGVPDERVVLTDSDLRIGDGCLLLRTPGHTSGNQTIFVHGDDGVFGSSENGTSCDSWAPHESRIPGLKSHARQYELEVVLNTNTPELFCEQYNSMILELSMVDRVPGAPAFPQMFPSSEVTPSPFAPGIRPTMVLGKRESGTVQPGRSRRRAVAAADARV